MKKITRIRSMLLSMVLLSGCGAVSDADEKIFLNQREADRIERQFLYLASYLNSVKPCFLIHPQSVTIAPFNSAGTKVSFVRSNCFRNVVTHTGDDTLCQQVRSVSTLLFSGDKLNVARCRESAASVGSVRVGNNLNIQEMVVLAGYMENDIDLYLVAEGVFSSPAEAAQQRQQNPSSYWYEVRLTLPHSRDFFDRIDQLPGYSNSQDQAEMAAIPWQPRNFRQKTTRPFN